MTTASLTNPPTDATTPQLAAMLQNAGVSALSTGWIRVTGSDRVRWLNGMATNSVQALTPGQGNYNFFLNAQGRIQGDGNIFATPDALLIETAQAAALIPYLDHYIIMDDVELADISTLRHGLTLIGPKAIELLGSLNIDVSSLAELSFADLTWQNSALTVIRAHGPSLPRIELWLNSAEDANALLAALKNAGAVPCDPPALDALRIFEGTPLYGVDIRDRDLPQETNQTRALHFAKGCYLGQEIVERIRSRGAVHRTFTTFRLEGDLATPGAVLESAGKAAGELTSVTTIAAENGPVHVALGYARREALDRQEPLTYPGGVAHPTVPSAAAEIKLPR